MTGTNRNVWGCRGLAAALSLSLGCSFAFVEPARPKPQPAREVECTRTKGWPVVDLLWVTIGVGGTLNAASASDADYDNAIFSRQNALILRGTVAAVALFSAIYGFSSVNRCNALHGATTSGGPPLPAPPPAPSPPPTALTPGRV